jgi:nitrite reductase (NO-forming)
MRGHRSTHLLTLVALVAACTPAASAPGWTYGPVGSPAPAPASTSPTSGAPDGGGDVLGTIDITGIDIAYEPAHVEVEQAGRYEVNFKNDGAVAHDVTFADGTTATAEAGQTAVVEVDVPSEGLSFLCSVPGHADAGMEGMIMVKGGATPAPDDHGGPAPSGDVAADPDAPAYTLFDPAAPPLRSGRAHEIELVIEEKPMTVAAGFVQQVWTFNGTVPGPAIRVKVGDTIRVTLRNPTSAAVSHSIDFHSSQVAWNDEMRSIAPGEELVYEWRADYAGVWMYHCGTSPALHHIANGMYGMVIVEPEDGLPSVDAEFAVVQSEWYLGPQGEPASLAKAAAAAPAPDYVVFNGVANQYLDNPIEVGTGDRVRVFVLNAGPSIDSSFHVVGTIFSAVTKEGVHLVPGNDGSWGSQAVDLAPAQGAIVEFDMPEEGLYPMVTHAFNFVGRGALGLFQAGDGDPLN